VYERKESKRKNEKEKEESEKCGKVAHSRKRKMLTERE